MTDSAPAFRLWLPRHRIHPGSVVTVFTTKAGKRRFTLPSGVAPGSRIVLQPDDGSVAVTVVITLLEPP
jgi:hypothetical protein